MPFTTRPRSTSRHGMMRLASKVPSGPGEVPEQAQARRLTLLRVELHAADVRARDDRGVGQTVLRLADDGRRLAARVAVEGVDEVEERPAFDAFGQRVALRPRDAVPADLRHA